MPGSAAIFTTCWRALAARDDGTRYTVFCHDAPPAADPARGPAYCASSPAASTTEEPDTAHPVRAGRAAVAAARPRRPAARAGQRRAAGSPVVPSVVTIHDLTFLVVPERFLPAKRRYLADLYAPDACRVARHVIADSEHTRQDVIRLLDVPPERVTPCRSAWSHTSSRPTTRRWQAFRARARPAGAVPPVPGHAGAAQESGHAVACLCARCAGRGLDWPLVLAGGKGWLYEDIFRAGRDLGPERSVRLPRLRLLRGAAAVVRRRPRSLSTHPPTKVSACPFWKRWPAAPRSSPRRPVRCPRRRVTQALLVDCHDDERAGRGASSALPATLRCAPSYAAAASRVRPSSRGRARREDRTLCVRRVYSRGDRAR